MKTETNIVNGNNSGSNNSSEMIEGTTWTYFEAAAAAKELNREARLFPKDRQPVPFLYRSSRKPSARFMADFLAQTGWSWADAVAEARDYGSRQQAHGLHVHGLQLYGEC